MPLCNHLSFGSDPDTSIKYYTNVTGAKNIGELDAKNRLSGRGIEIYSSGLIVIGYFQRGAPTTGNCIRIYSDGVF